MVRATPTMFVMPWLRRKVPPGQPSPAKTNTCKSKTAVSGFSYPNTNNQGWCILLLYTPLHAPRRARRGRRGNITFSVFANSRIVPSSAIRSPCLTTEASPWHLCCPACSGTSALLLAACFCTIAQRPKMCGPEKRSMDDHP